MGGSASFVLWFSSFVKTGGGEHFLCSGEPVDIKEKGMKKELQIYFWNSFWQVL